MYVCMYVCVSFSSLNPHTQIIIIIQKERRGLLHPRPYNHLRQEHHGKQLTTAMPILVSYATSNGSTRTVAERIALRLSQQLAPAEVDCVPAATAPLLSSAEGKKYSAVVIGSAVHAGYWIGPGRRFLKQNGPYLSSGAEGVAPVWAFSVGMPPTDDDLAKEQAMLEKRLRSH